MEAEKIQNKWNEICQELDLFNQKNIIKKFSNDSELL
jgi:hypothetical protein